MSVATVLISFILLLFLFQPCLSSLYNAELYQSKAKSMFTHAFNGYMKYAFPKDELRPLTCTGSDTLGGYSLTLIDSLDALVIFGMYTEFATAVDWIIENVSFDLNKNVSVFETNIRLLGSLLSAHLLCSDVNSPVYRPSIGNDKGPLLLLAIDLADRLLPAFDTPTGMPFGTVNLMYGVPLNETPMVATAGVGTFILEFATLSRITGDVKYEIVAHDAMKALFMFKSSKSLFGHHINSTDGKWSGPVGGVGNYVDSFYEYLLKGHILLENTEYLSMFEEVYDSVKSHMMWRNIPVLCDIFTGYKYIPAVDSLQAFWPGLQVLFGDVYNTATDWGSSTNSAISGLDALIDISKKLNYFFPETVDPVTGMSSRPSYKLRPELVESIYYAYSATSEDYLLEHAMRMLDSLEDICKTPCGYASVSDVMLLDIENQMDSFFLAETLKYFYLLFSIPSQKSKDKIECQSGNEFDFTILPSCPGSSEINDSSELSKKNDLSWFFNDNYIFTTEAHILSVSHLRRNQLYSNTPTIF